MCFRVAQTVLARDAHRSARRCRQRMKSRTSRSGSFASVLFGVGETVCVQTRHARQLSMSMTESRWQGIARTR